MKTSKVSFRLSPNEEALVLQKERDRRRRLRIQQVREQERDFAKLVRKQVEVKRKQELCILAGQLEQEWLEAKLEKKATLNEIYRKKLETVGTAHALAQEQPPFEEIRERTKVENAKKARDRGKKAIQKQQEDDEEKIQEEFAHVMARKTALEIERARAALIAKKPQRSSDVSQPEPIKQPTRVLHQEGFSTTHYNIPTEYAEKADPEEQGDAKRAAIDEEERLKEETKERRQELVERQTKASLRQKHAQEKTRLARARSDLMDELGQMEQADRRRRQLIVSNIPKQIFQPPHKRLEEKDDHQKDLEEAFENMYMAKTDYVGDLELALEPALPQVEADLDLSSDSPGEEFHIPDKKQLPKKFPQGVDGVHRKPALAKKDTLKKLLLKIHSQKQDHKTRQKAELVGGDSVDSQPLAPPISSFISSSAVSSDLTASSVTDDAKKSEISSQTLSQHPLSNESDATSQTTSSGSVSLETGTISDGSLVVDGVTLMHPLEEARRARGMEGEGSTHNNRPRGLDIRKMTELPETFQQLTSEPSTPLTTIPVYDHREAGEANASEQQQFYGHTTGNASDYKYQQGIPLQGEGRRRVPYQSHVSYSNAGRNGNDIPGDGYRTSIPAGPYHPSQSRMYPSSAPMEEDVAAYQHQLPSTPDDDRGTGHYLRTGMEGIPVNQQQRHGIQNNQPSHHFGGRERLDPTIDVEQSHDSLRHPTFLRKQGPDFKNLRRNQGTVEPPDQESHPGLDTNQPPYAGRKGPQRSEVSPNGYSDGLPQGLHKVQHGVNFRENSSTLSSMETMPQSHLESVRQKYPNIYETLTGREPLLNEPEMKLSSNSKHSENDSPPLHTHRKVRGHNAQGIMGKHLREDQRRNVTLREASPKKHSTRSHVTKRFHNQRQDDEMRISIDQHTFNQQEELRNSPQEAFTVDQDSMKTKQSASEFQSLLHDYQQQLLKLQRTNEAEIIEAQSQLRERRQRLLELYSPLQELPSEVSDVSLGQQKLKDVRAGRVMQTSENLSNGTVVNKHPFGSGRVSREEEHRYNSSSGSFVSNGGSSRDYDNHQRRFTNDTYNDDKTQPSPSSGIDIRMSGMTEHQSVMHPSYNSVYGHGTNVLSSNQYHDGSQQGMNSQSFGTPPIYNDQAVTGLQAESTDSSHFLPLSPKISVSLEASSQSNGSPRQGTSEPLSSTLRMTSQAIVSEVPTGQRFPRVDEDNHYSSQSDDQWRRVQGTYFTHPGEDQTVGVTSTKITWKPVKELHVSLPNVADGDGEEQYSPRRLSSSVLTDDNSPFPESPSSPPVKKSTLDSAILGQGLLTPRKIALSEARPFLAPSQSSSMEGEAITTGRRSSSGESVSPGKLITPRMLLGDHIDNRENEVSKMTRSTLSSAKGSLDVIMAHSVTQRPHADSINLSADDHPSVFQRQESLMAADSDLPSTTRGGGQERIYDNESLEQGRLSDSITSDFTQAYPSSHIPWSGNDETISDAEPTLSSRMLLGDGINNRENDVVKMTRSTLSSAKESLDAIMERSVTRRPHSDSIDLPVYDHPSVFHRQEILMAADSDLPSATRGGGQERIYDNESLEQIRLSESVTSDITQAQAFPSLHIPWSGNDETISDAESTLSSTNQGESFQHIGGTSTFQRKPAYFNQDWNESERHIPPSQNSEMQTFDQLRYQPPPPEKDVISEGSQDRSETTSSIIHRVKYQPGDTGGTGNLISDQKVTNLLDAGDLPSTDGRSSSEEPTDRGLLEALKNLMLAKARRQVPGTPATTTNYFSHLDLTKFEASSEREPSEMNQGDQDETTEDVSNEGEIWEEDGEEAEMEIDNEAEEVFDRQRLRHRPPVANYSKLILFDEVAPHELSTIIEVESPLFETLPALSFTGGKDTSWFGKEGTPPMSSSSDVTSTSSWGTPRHHESVFSRSSGSGSPRDIYIHRPTMAFPLDEDTFADEGSSNLSRGSMMTQTHDDVRNILHSYQPSSGDISSSQLSQEGMADKGPIHQSQLLSTERFPEIGNGGKVDDNVTISEGPINTSSEPSIDASQITDEDRSVEDSSLHDQLFPLSLEVLKMRNASPGTAEAKHLHYEPGSSQREGDSIDAGFFDPLVSRELKESDLAAESLESSNFIYRGAKAGDVEEERSLEDTTGDGSIPFNNQEHIPLTRYGSGHVPSSQETQRRGASPMKKDLFDDIYEDTKGEERLSDAKLQPPLFMRDKPHYAEDYVVPMLEEGPLEDTLEQTRCTANTEEDCTFHSLVPQDTISESLDNRSEVYHSRHDVLEGVSSVEALGVDRRSFKPGPSPARFFTEVKGHLHSPNDTSDSGRDEWSQQHSGARSETTSELMTVETGIMEEPELTFQTTFDTNVTLESIVGEHAQGGSHFSSASESLLSFIKHEEQFSHSTPMKPDNRSPRHHQGRMIDERENREQLNTNSNAQSRPLTLQEALARHKASFITASQTRQTAVKAQKGNKEPSGTAFAMTIKNWQKARLQAQQKNRQKGMKKPSSGNKENVEKIGTVPRVKTSQDRKLAQNADKQRTKRLYNQLEEVKHRQVEAERQETYAENRRKRKEYEDKLKKRRILLAKSQAQAKT